MEIGLIGAGNMARALAVGWARPLLCTDAVPARATALAADVGGEALASNAEVAERADVVFLCHKPAQLDAVASEIAGAAKAVASILGGVALEDLERAYPGTPVVRLMPNTAVEVRRGVICLARGAAAGDDLVDRLTALLSELGTVVALEERLINAATGIMSVTPAYLALIVEAWVDAGVKHGLTGEQASELLIPALAGSAELLAARGGDTLAVRRAVTSPGGITAQGLGALEDAGLRAAFVSALDAIMAAQR